MSFAPIDAPLVKSVITDSVSSANEITFGVFLKEVAAANLNYAVQRYNVSIAETSVAAAKVFQKSGSGGLATDPCYPTN